MTLFILIVAGLLPAVNVLGSTMERTETLLLSKLRTVTVHEQEDGKSFTDRLYYWIDESSSLDRGAVLEKVREGKFTESKSKALRFGFTHKYHSLWLIAVLENPGQAPLDMVIEHPYPSLTANFYYYDEKQDKWMFGRNGFLHLNQGKALDYRLPYFEVKLQPGKNLFLFQVNAMMLEAPFLIWSTGLFAKHVVMDATVIGLVFGGYAVILLYNFLTYLTSRRVEYLIYVCYLVSLLGFQLFLQGYGAWVFGELAYPLLVEPAAIWAATMVVFMNIFAVRFLSLKRHMSRTRNVFAWLNALLVLAMAISNADWVAGSFILSILGTVSIVLITYAGIKRAQSGFRPAMFYLLAWSCMGTGSFIYVLSLLNLSSHSVFVTMSALLIGGLVEAILLSLAIGDKISLNLKEQNRQIQEEQQKRLHAFRQMEKVFFPHQVLKIGAGESLESTMPTVPGEACVISFDIVGSSRIRHEKAKEFFRNVFRRCNEAMMEGYDGENLNANAYRIKEMGDGFLCSVGYPFHSATGHMAMDALQLALQFHKILQEEAELLQSDEPICCGIGIALDHIVGFYPESGTREYDLFGRAIVLATRYEGMRKAILRNGQSGSIIILQETVYISLSREARIEFTKVELGGKGLVVRDDASATNLYYKVLQTASASAMPKAS